MNLPKEIESKFESVINLCIDHKVKRLFIFGSLAKGNFTSESDIDLIVEIEEEDPIKRGELLIALWNKLESLFNRKVDLLTSKKINNPFLMREIERSKQLIYERAS